MARLDAGSVKTRKDAPSTQPPGTNLKDMLDGKPGVPTSLKGVLFGPPKTAKTTIAASGGKTLLINFDPEGYATKTLRGRKDIDIVQPQNMRETDAVVEALVRGDGAEYAWKVLDSVTFMFQVFGGKDILKTYQAGKDIRRAYGQAGAAASQIINDLALLKNSNVLFIAHLAREGSDDDGGVDVEQDLGEHEVKLAVTPMVWKILGPAVGFIGRTFKQEERIDGNMETKYYVSFNDGGRSPAGSRYDMAGMYEASDTLLSDLVSDLL